MKPCESCVRRENVPIILQNNRNMILEIEACNELEKERNERREELPEKDEEYKDADKAELL